MHSPPPKRGIDGEESSGRKSLGLEFFPQKERGDPGGALTPPLLGSSGRGRGGAWVEGVLRSEKPQSLPQRLSAVTFHLGHWSFSAAFSFGE